MLPLVLVYLFAQTAFALPTVPVSYYQIGDPQGIIPDNGQLINKNITVGALEWIDGGDTSLYLQDLLYTVTELADWKLPIGQAAAGLQTIALLGELANGTPGDACEPTAFINSAIKNNGKLKVALIRFIKYFIGYIDTIVDLVVDPVSVHYSSGRTSSCLGGGRIYQIEVIWDIIRASTKTPIGAEYANYEYCAAKRLYNAFNIRSNNVAAAITATAIRPVSQIGLIALGPLANFLRIVAYGGNPAQAGEILKAALLKAASKIKC